MSGKRYKMCMCDVCKTEARPSNTCHCNDAENNAMPQKTPAGFKVTLYRTIPCDYYPNPRSDPNNKSKWEVIPLFYDSRGPNNAIAEINRLDGRQLPHNTVKYSYTLDSVSNNKGYLAQKKSDNCTFCFCHVDEPLGTFIEIDTTDCGGIYSLILTIETDTELIIGYNKSGKTENNKVTGLYTINCFIFVGKIAMNLPLRLNRLLKYFPGSANSAMNYINASQEIINAYSSGYGMNNRLIDNYNSAYKTLRQGNNGGRDRFEILIEASPYYQRNIGLSEGIIEQIKQDKENLILERETFNLFNIIIHTIINPDYRSSAYLKTATDAFIQIACVILDEQFFGNTPSMTSDIITAEDILSEFSQGYFSYSYIKIAWEATVRIFKKYIKPIIKAGVAAVATAAATPVAGPAAPAAGLEAAEKVEIVTKGIEIGGIVVFSIIDIFRLAKYPNVKIPMRIPVNIIIVSDNYDLKQSMIYFYVPITAPDDAIDTDEDAIKTDEDGRRYFVHEVVENDVISWLCYHTFRDGTSDTWSRITKANGDRFEEEEVDHIEPGWRLRIYIDEEKGKPYTLVRLPDEWGVRDRIKELANYGRGWIEGWNAAHE